MTMRIVLGRPFDNVQFFTNKGNAMPYVPVLNTAQLELLYIWNNQRCENVLHYVKASPWDNTTLTQLCAAAVSKWAAHFASFMPNTLSLVEIIATDMASNTGPVVNFGTGLPIVGGTTNPSLPNNCSVVVTKRTALRGRSYRGRIYHPGLTEGMVIDNQVVTASLTLTMNAWNQFKVLAIGGDEALLCVVSRIQNDVPLATGIATLVTQLTSDGLVDSQRRRLPGRGA